MDAFMEKIVKRKKVPADYMLVAALYVAATLLTILALMFIDASFSLIIGVGLFFGAHWLTQLRSLEFEMAYTNGDVDIDRIIAQRKRKRIFSQNCKEFELVARVGSAQYTPQIASNKNVIDASSGVRSEHVWFALTRYDSKSMVLYFEPSSAMLEAMAILIPRKLFR